MFTGNHTKISPKTKNIFIDITATDLTKAKVVLDTLVTLFSQYCAQPFTYVFKGLRSNLPIVREHAQITKTRLDVVHL